MGKADIVSHAGEGLYNVKIKYDMRRIDAAKIRLTARLNSLNESLQEAYGIEYACGLDNDPQDDDNDIDDTFEPDIEEESDYEPDIEEEPEGEEPSGAFTISGTVSGE